MPLPNINPQPQNVTIATHWHTTEAGDQEFLPLPPATFFVGQDAPDPTFQWQTSTDGTTWTNLTNAGVFSGTDTNTLTISDPTGLSGHQFRVLVASTDRGGPQTATSNAATLTIVQNAPIRPCALFDCGGRIPVKSYNANDFPPL